MGYTLKAEIHDMSREEARALVAAILEEHGGELVDQEREKWRQKSQSMSYARSQISEYIARMDKDQ